MTNNNAALYGVGGLAALAYLASREPGGDGSGILDQLTGALAELRGDVEQLADDVAGEQGATESTETNADSVSGVQSSTSRETRSTGSYSGGTSFTYADTSGETSEVFIGGLVGGDLTEQDTDAVESALRVGTVDQDTGLIQGD